MIWQFKSDSTTGGPDMAHLKKIAAVGLTLATMVSMFPMTSLAATKEGWKKEKGKNYYI